MAEGGLLAERDAASWQRRLDGPQSGLVCVAGWLLATAIFCGMVALLGGPTQSDSSESLYATWSIAHGHLACAYPPASSVTSSFYLFYQPIPPVPPLWPLLSGGLAWLTRIGHTVPFPSQHALGVNCAHAYGQVYLWARHSYALFATLGLGYAAWFVLLAGLIAVLRASGRGRSGWEPFAVVLVALVPITWTPLLNYYHPQDLVAVGLALASIACVERRQWVWAGVFVGLAVTSQQFALLVLAPLFVVAPGRERWRLLVASAGVAAVVSLPVIVATSGRAIHAVVFGTGDSGTLGGTLVWELGLHGPALVFVSRILPILVAAALAWWALRRLGSRVLEPIPLISLVATALSMRLVFEQGLFGYKFMALAVMLIVLAVVRGRVRGRLIAWLALATLAFNPIPVGYEINARPWGHHVAFALPMICLAVVLVLIVSDAVHRRIRWYLVAWFAIAAWAFLQWPLWSPDSLRAPFPKWFWQLVLLSTGVVMAVGPLVREMRKGTGTRTPDHAEDGAPGAAPPGPVELLAGE